MSKLLLKDYLHRAVTLSLFGVTCMGAAVFVDGGYDIVRRRFGYTGPKKITPPVDTETAEKK